MGNVIPIERALGTQAKRTKYFTVYSSGRIQYTDLGRRYFGSWFGRFGIDIRRIQTESEHLQASRHCDDNEITEVFDVEVTHQEQDLSDALLDDLLNSDIAHRPTIRDLVTQRDRFLNTSEE